MRVYQTQFYALDNQRLDEGLASCLLKEGIAVNSTASIDYTDASNPKVLGNPTEGALLLWLKDNQVSYQELREAVQVIDELPFYYGT